MMYGGRFDRQIIMTSFGVDFLQCERHQREARVINLQMQGQSAKCVNAAPPVVVQRQHKKLLAQAFVKHAKNRNGMKKEQREMRPTK
jgi:hypothetical protein